MKPPPVELRAVVQGAFLALAVTVPTILVTKVVDATVGIRADSNALFWPYLLVLIGLVAGGRRAARRHPEAAMTHGALGAGAAYLVMGVVIVILRLAQGDAVNLAGVVVQAMIALSAGTLGGMLSLRRGTGGGNDDRGRRVQPRPGGEGWPA